jgi:CRISPR-associated endonuclease/helicase Cas3
MAEPESSTTQGTTPLLEEFRGMFRLLTGYAPFPWQEKLYVEFLKNEIPSSCNLPTGLGKTSVVAIWLIALANGAKVPRRLAYVVNRRTVVDQTTAEVERVRSKIIEEAGIADALRRACSLEDNVPPLVISTLRGQLADNREWSADPSRPAVICGTVDMIGSRLLFSGYGIGFKSRPLHAGFLGQDVLLVHDEAHLEPAFQELISQIEKEQERERELTGNLPWPKLRVMQLTATTRNDNGQAEEPFGLTLEEKNPPEIIPEQKEDEPSIYAVWRRLKATKTLYLKKADDDTEIAEEIAKRALKLSKDDKGNDTNAAVLIFVRTLDDVQKVCTVLTNKKYGVPADHVQQLTGTMRGLERDQMADPRRHDASPVFARFLKPPKPDAPEKERWETTPMPGTVYLVCTSAGEVGVDISADHLVCDLSTFESMVQRFGRVNRFGQRDDTRVEVVHPASFGKVDKNGELKASEIDSRLKRTLELLRLLPPLGNNTYDASPKALDDLWQRTDLPYRGDQVFARKPTIVPATDILFDAWALTSIREPMPGRPEVAPYLHGIADDLPQTTIVWREELDLLKDNPNPKPVLRAILAKHGIRPHESLTVASSQAVKFLKKITASKAYPELLETQVALVFSRSLELTTVRELIANAGWLNTDPTLILPASFGGLEKGMLAILRPGNNKEGAATNAKGDDGSESKAAAMLDVADVGGYEREREAKPRRRVLIERTSDGWIAHAVTAAASLPDDWDLEEPLERLLLIKRIQEKSGLKVRLVQPIKWNEEDKPICELVCLSPPPRQRKSVEQVLKEHVNKVEEEAKRLADRLELCEPFRSALLFAATWHDEGKKAATWQRYAGTGNGELLGKTSEWHNPRLLNGYRHEFGSLLRSVPYLPNDADVRELALHLIAAHHGHGRPHFENIIDHDFTTRQSKDAHVEVMRRYARLQRRYGRWGLAYLESLLRAADWAASAEVGVDPEVDDDDPAEFEGNEA